MKGSISRRDFIKKTSRYATVAGLGASGILLKGCSSKTEYDLVIKNGRVFDGLGNDAVAADIGISGQKIVKVGKISAAKGQSVIDANNLAVCPGFIDAHDHTATELLVNPKAESSIRHEFEQRYAQLYGHRPVNRDVELESLRVVASSMPETDPSATVEPGRSL